MDRKGKGGKGSLGDVRKCNRKKARVCREKE